MKSKETEQLVVDNMRLVYYMLNKHYPTYIQDEDLQQCGMIGLIQAAETWDPSISQFSTFASKCIMNEFAKEFKRRNKHIGVLSLDYELSTDEGEVQAFGDHIAGETDIDYVDYRGYYATLSPREKQMVELKLKGYNEIEIAKETGWSKQYTYATMRSAKRKWERYYGKNSN